MTQAATIKGPTLRKDDFIATGAGTPAGRYMRQFWQPIYHGCDLVQGKPVPLRIMGDDFTLYRGETGIFLVDARCPHRGMQLSAAWVEGDALRCFYHGWKFAGHGACLEQPAEENAFCGKVQLTSKPVHEYLGLIFAYFGEGEPPDLPRYPEFENFDGLLEIDSYFRDCNYFQNLENALDMAHVGFTHGDNQAAFNGIGLGRSLRAEESDWGVTYTFTRSDGQLRVQQFGMPNVFYMNALPTDPDIGWQESLFWWVPIDDDRHIQFSLHRVPVVGEAAERVHNRRQKRREEIDLPHQVVCEQILGGMISIRDVDYKRVDLVRLQDDVAQIGQGRRADRGAERLGRSDIGIAVIRRLWRRELGFMLEGKRQKHWMRNNRIIPKTWGLAGKPAPRMGGIDEKAGGARVVDARPYVEIEMQRQALHDIKRS
ncbi:Rieske 2Fe-2S domain-containing protein [Reyranella sp. CPCC 100927]|uniref:Rieske 2Fe-2S domain-containing protein n=1 Tax=Reyranella sp. CPCC 100927 TaxID=2599616 RepID=UPI0011B84379|nr:Rieske 2Fe-2S domain-containing protein [Reyranella sp. CPCC 100927]TWS99837.1 Rieske 2Fe-2S domain-containing protein [Reyranella sp. CPCC 100927]